MSGVPFIPFDADVANPKWDIAYRQLAQAMIEEGAKAALIEWYTSLSHTTVTQLYVAVTGKHAPSGPIAQLQPRFFVRNAKARIAMNLQSCSFLRCYQELARAFAPARASEGWLIYQAYAAFRRLTEPKAEVVLQFSHVGQLVRLWGSNPGRRGELDVVTCPLCGQVRLIETQAEVSPDGCPSCAAREAQRKLIERNKLGVARARAC